MGEQLFLYNLEVIHRLEKNKKQKRLQLILRGMCSALGSPAKRAPSRTVFCSSPGSASPAVCLHSSRSSSPVTLPPFINRLRRTFWTCYHSAHTVLSRPDGNTSSGRSRTHCSVGATCFINSNEGAAEGSESEPCAVRCLHSAV